MLQAIPLTNIHSCTCTLADSFIHSLSVILSYTDDDNRITLRPMSGHEDCQNEYINACYIEVSKYYDIHSLIV